MPLGDGTGPSGLGPMTGRAAGYCAGYAVPGYMNPIGGRGMGWGRGFGRGGGRGFRRRFFAGMPVYPIAAPVYGAGIPFSPAYTAPSAPANAAELELAALRNQAELIKNSLDAITQRIEMLETAQPKKEDD